MYFSETNKTQNYKLCLQWEKRQILFYSTSTSSMVVTVLKQNLYI